MSLFIASLNSGSNGNCYYIGNQHSAVLVDAGISCREIEKRMKRLRLSIDLVKAVFISHEHSDHISGVATLSRKFKVPVYITEPTQKLSRLSLSRDLVRRFATEEPIMVGDLQIIAFEKFHDAGDPHSFMVSGSGVNIGVFTDIGIACKRITHYFKQCHAAFLESNYDEDMLMNGNYPQHLKKRIADDRGHLSNNQALELFLKHRPPHLSHLVLSHLSKNNNDPSLVSELFHPHRKNTLIVVASRYEETNVIEINPVVKAPVLPLAPVKAPRPRQLSLF